MSEQIQNIHFIAIGGAAMHNLALALHEAGHRVTGSDDAIFEPSKTRLHQKGLLPEQEGWFPDKIHEGLHAVIIGMHAKSDNPELVKAKALSLPIYSFPEYIYEHSKNKQRIVIAGSHGKTTITAIILHVMRHHNRDVDYMVGAQLEGFDTMVRLSNTAPIIVLEGDEYPSSPTDPRPKFMHYHHHIGLISGIAWDHINVYPTMESYVQQFDNFADSTPKAGILIYNEGDDLSAMIGRKERDDVSSVEYSIHKHEIVNGQTFLITDYKKVPLQVFGKHNMKNIAAAKAVCNKIGINDEMFYKALPSFRGASNRLELVAKSNSVSVYKDFAHAPSKLKATVNAVRKQFPDRSLVAVLELHTFSSLNKDFLGQYRETFDHPQLPIVFINPKALSSKGLPEITEQEVQDAFENDQIRLITDAQELEALLKKQSWDYRNLLLMSSGNFGGLDIPALAKTITKS
jgi:UDP-N-acetylmuramate: L-alanyl-gamma-D-glutamyl-meso-diaminopimelate ligase